MILYQSERQRRTLTGQELVNDYGKDVYPCIEEKAVNLLYFIVKNHAFTDENKRIAAAIFSSSMAFSIVPMAASVWLTMRW